MKINNKGKNKIVNLNIKRCCHREKFISNFVSVKKFLPS